MTHFEANAIRLYYESLDYARDIDLELRYNSNDKIEYYKDTNFNMKEYKNFKSMWNDKMSYFEIEKYTDEIAEYLDKLDDIFNNKVSIC